MKKIIFIIVLNISLVAVQYFLTTTMATTGKELAHLSTRVDTLRQANEQLRLSVLSASSLSRILTEAQIQHLTPISFDFSVPASVALNP